MLEPVNSEYDSFFGIIFYILIQLGFVILKLFNIIDWAWWIVLSPIWIPGAFGFLLFILIFIFLICEIFVNWLKNRELFK